MARFKHRRPRRPRRVTRIRPLRPGIGAEEYNGSRKVPLWAAMLALVGTAMYFGKGR